MANALYPKWKEQIIQVTATADLSGTGTAGTFIALVDLGVYTYSAAHEFYNPDLSGIVGTDQEIGATKTFVDGVLDGADLTYSSVSGATVEALVGYVKNAGADTTWRLWLFLDTSVTGLPVTPNGGDITVTWNGSGIVGL